MSEKPQIVRVGVGVAIFDARGRLLMERRQDNGKWGFIGGALQFGESVSACAVREAEEETGLRLASEFVLLGVYSHPQMVTVEYPERFVQKIDLLLRCTHYSGELRISSESTELRFWSFTDIDLNSVDTNALLPLTDLMSHTTGGVVK